MVRMDDVVSLHEYEELARSFACAVDERDRLRMELEEKTGMAAAAEGMLKHSFGDGEPDWDGWLEKNALLARWYKDSLVNRAETARKLLVV